MSGMRASFNPPSTQSSVTPSSRSAAPNESVDQPLTFPQKLMVGGFAGVVGSMIVFPVDTVKAHLMTQKPKPNGTMPYKSVWDCAKQIHSAGGMSAFYKGLRANLVGVTPEKAIKLGVNDWMRDQFAAQNSKNKVHGNAGNGLFMWQAILCGSTAGTVQCIATNPMEIVKIRMQLAAQAAQAATTRAASEGTVAAASAIAVPSMADTVRGLGLRGLYRGSAATLLRDVPFSALFFPVYGLLKKRLQPFGVSPLGELLVPLVAGTASGAAAAVVVTPMDVIKTRLQAKGGAKLYNGVWDCGKKLLAQEGPHSLMSGWLPRAMLVGPLFGISLLSFELFKAFMRSQRDNAAVV